MLDCLGGLRQNADKLRDLVGIFGAIFRPSVVRKRLQRLKELGHCEVIPTLPQLLSLPETNSRSVSEPIQKSSMKPRGFPGYHNFRRFVAFPTTMMDPVDFFPANTIIQHVSRRFIGMPPTTWFFFMVMRGGLRRCSANWISWRRKPSASTVPGFIGRGWFVPRAPSPGCAGVHCQSTD